MGRGSWARASGGPSISVEDLFLKMEAQGLTEMVDIFKPYAHPSLG
jgi:hypothetical protein